MNDTGDNIQLEENDFEGVAEDTGDMELLEQQTENVASVDNSTTTSSTFLVEEDNSDIVAQLSLLNHTNYILCALLLAVFLYLFFRDFFERRKV